MNILIPYQFDPYGTELIYTLRAAQKYVGDAQLYIIGDQPAGLTNYIYIPYPHCTDNKYKERNIFEKLLQGPEEFIALYDDEILLQPFNPMPRTIPWTWKDWLGRGTDGGTYKYSVENTKMLFGRAVLNYDRHYPMVMDRESLAIWDGRMSLVKRWPDYGYCVKSLYGNGRMLPHISGEDCKLRYVPVTEDWRAWDCVSTTPETWKAIKPVIAEMFNHKCRWEL